MTTWITVMLCVYYLVAGLIAMDYKKARLWKWWQLAVLLPFWLPIVLMRTIFDV